MKKSLIALTFISVTSLPLVLSGRELLCELCEPEPTCWEHLFVERPQIFLHTEFLYWTVVEGGLDYAVFDRAVPNLLSTFGDGDLKLAEYDWRPGFRAAINYYRCSHYWEAGLQYTWFFDEGSDSTDFSLNATKFLTPTRQTNSTTSNYENAHGELGFHYHLGDIFVARVFDPNSHLRMRLLGSITIGHLDQNFKLDYRLKNGISEKIEEKWRFFGGGLRAGVTVDWFWGYQFYFTGRATFAALYGTYKNTETQSRFSSLGEETPIGNVEYDAPRLSLHTQFILGPSWQIPSDCWSFELFAGYELNAWSNIHERMHFPLQMPSSESRQSFYSNWLLGMHGLTIRLTLGF